MFVPGIFFWVCRKFVSNAGSYPSCLHTKLVCLSPGKIFKDAGVFIPVKFLVLTMFASKAGSYLSLASNDIDPRS